MGTADTELPAYLTDAFDGFEAAWNAARGFD
jgi:hypothetical protein